MSIKIPDGKHPDPDRLSGLREVLADYIRDRKKAANCNRSAEPCPQPARLYLSGRAC